MKKIRKYLIFTLFLIVGFTANLNAQSDLEINKVFEQYGKKRGSVLVEMSREMLEDYDFTYYKSIVTTSNKEAADFARRCLAVDEKGAKKVKQVVSNGVVTSIYLQLPPKDNYYRLVLFNETTLPEQKMTLIYIESEKDSEEILKFILKRK
ncbi:MAG TPA: hypothetical protein PLH70_06910 [Bacteroidales bacterium]|nr:hypothetical protein [Bacteroidales bacterium]HPZ03818.1 hypothetical protein [Bacteroidales bacterium]HQB75510.1 hypothetical protein [Bacteroidales bacterium]